MKRITGRKNLRCNHKLSDAYALESVVRHTVQATLSKTLKHDWCKLAFRSIFVFNYEWISNFTHSEPIKISLKCMNETKKRLQKVFTLHYWRFFFFWFKYLFFVILFYYDMFIISSSGGWNVRKDTGQGVENQDPVTYVRRLYMNWHVHIQPRSLFLLETFAKSALFEDPAPRFVESVLIQERILL